MKILKLYEAIAEALDTVVDDDLLFIDYGDEKVPALQKTDGKNRQLVLPTYERIKAGFKDELHPFHPLCESVIEGQSPTIKWMQKNARRAIQLKGFGLVDEILKVAAGKKKPRSAVYANLMARVTEGLRNPKMDDMLLKSWNKLYKDIIDDEMKVPQIFLDANKKVDGKKFSRVCYYSHKFLDEAEDGSQYFFKTKLLRKSDKAILLRLLNEVFGMFPSETGSNDDRPYFASLMRGYREFVMAHNKIAHSLHEVTKVAKINDEWVSEIDELEKFEDKIQTLALNSGDISSEPRKAPATTVAEMRKPEVAQPSMASERPQPTETGKMSLSDLTRMRNGGAGTLANGYKNQAPMSEAERRAREGTPNNGPMNMFANHQQQQQQPSMFGTPDRQQPTSMLNSAPTLGTISQQPSLFGDQPTESLFGSNTGSGQTKSMFDMMNSSNKSMFD